MVPRTPYGVYSKTTVLNLSTRVKQSKITPLKILPWTPLDEYVTKLDHSGLSLIIYDGGEAVFKSQSKGIRPHLEAIEALGERLRGTTMVDKIVGRAAALLILYSGAAEVHAGIISRGGRELLEKGGVRLFYEEETAHIKTVDGRIYCPFEAMVQGINDPTHAYNAIVEKMVNLRKAG